MRRALRGTWLATETADDARVTADGWQAPRLPRAKHNRCIMFPPAGGLRSSRCEALCGSERHARTAASWRTLCGRCAARHCAPPAPTSGGSAAAGPTPAAASVRPCPRRHAKPPEKR
jgi:hypothetical protein